MGHLWSSLSTTVQIQEGRPRLEKFIESASKWLGIEEKGEWLKDMRGNLAMVATVVATMAFQVGLNPPGGVSQNGEDNGPPIYGLFLLFNSISFFSSLIVCLWLISGLPLQHRLPTWLLGVGMCISLSSLALTYLYGVLIITPNGNAYDLANNSIIVWFVVVGVVGLFLVMRFVLLFVAIFTKGTTTNASTTTPTQTDQVNRST